MINLQNVYLSYTKEYYTLFDISLDVATGKTMVVCGKNESGKSTLLRVIAGFEQPTKGQVTINNVPASQVDFKNDVSMGYLPSEGVFKENKSVLYNLKYPLKIRKVDKEMTEVKLYNALTTYDLGTVAKLKMRQLQPFDRIKVALARFSLRGIDLFLVDDIFRALGASDAKKVVKYLQDLIKNNNATAIIACSDENIAKMFKGEVVHLEQGAISA